MRQGGLERLILILALLASTPSVHAGQQVGENSAYAREMGFETHLFYGTSGNALNQVEYICRAFPGTTGSDDLTSSIWQVQRFTYSTVGVTDIEFAGDDDAFRNQCSNRVNLDYD